MHPVAAASKTGRNLDMGPHGATSQRKSGTFPITCDCLYQSSLKVSLYLTPDRVNFMLTRRSFLTTAGILALGPFLSSCASSGANLRVLLLKGSVPPQLLKVFRQQIPSASSLDFHMLQEFIPFYMYIPRVPSIWALTLLQNPITFTTLKITASLLA